MVKYPLWVRVARVRFPAKPFFSRRRRKGRGRGSGKERGRKEKRKGAETLRAFLAQSVERAAFNRKVVGSRPTGGVFLSEGGRGVRQDKEKRTGIVGGRIAQW